MSKFIIDLGSLDPHEVAKELAHVAESGLPAASGNLYWGGRAYVSKIADQIKRQASSMVTP